VPKQRELLSVEHFGSIFPAKMRFRLGFSSYAWEPITPRGVAAFGHAPIRRVLIVQLVVALMIAVTVVWFLSRVCFPTVLAAIRQLPGNGEIHHGEVAWPGETPVVLSESRWLSVVVDLNHAADLGHDANFCAEFGQRSIRIISLFGHLDFAYPVNWRMDINRLEVEAWWGAWSPFLLAGAAVTAVLCLAVIWTVLATIYCVPVWIVAVFANRQLTIAQSWKLAAAALMPGAVAMTGATLLYGVGWLNIVRFMICFGLHFLVGWIYIILCPFLLPRDLTTSAARKNPFASSADPRSPPRKPAP
jgi:hypothetical protein